MAASLAWLAATELFGHPRPFFAPVAAVITLGLSLGQRRRRAVEMAFGVALGILVADLLVVPDRHRHVADRGGDRARDGRGAAAGRRAAAGVAGGHLGRARDARIQVPTDGISLARFLDALAGGAIALAVATLLLPVEPAQVVRRAVQPVLDQLALALETLADALDRRDQETAELAVLRARAIVLWRAARGARRRPRQHPPDASARAPSPARRALRATSCPSLELAVNNVRVVARGVGRALALGDATPPRLTTAVRSLAEAVRALEADDAEAARDAALRAAEDANAVLQETGNMSALHIVGQVRSTAVDLMRAAGVEHAEAVSGVRASAGAASPGEDDPKNAARPRRTSGALPRPRSFRELTGPGKSFLPVATTYGGPSPQRGS